MSLRVGVGFADTVDSLVAICPLAALSVGRLHHPGKTIWQVSKARLLGRRWCANLDPDGRPRTVTNLAHDEPIVAGRFTARSRADIGSHRIRGRKSLGEPLSNGGHQHCAVLPLDDRVPLLVEDQALDATPE